MSGTDVLIERAMCEQCGHPVHSHDGKRGWIHTLTQTYRCPQYPHGWAQPCLDIESRVTEAAELASETGYDAGESDGRVAGRQAMFDEIQSAVVDSVGGLYDGTGQVALDDVYGALDQVWERVTP